MKMLINSAIISLAVALTACSSGSDSKAVDSSGNCTQETISLNNDIKHKADMYDISKGTDLDYLKGVKDSCVKLKSIIGDKTCTAVNPKSNENVTFSFANVAGACAQAEKILSPKAESSPKVETTVASKKISPDDSKLLTNGFIVKIKDLSKLKQLISSTDGTDVFVQNGKLLPNIYDMKRKGSAVCFMNNAEDAKSPGTDGIIVFDVIAKEEAKEFIAGSNSLNIAFGCASSGKSFDRWTLGDLREAYGDLLEINAR